MHKSEGFWAWKVKKKNLYQHGHLGWLHVGHKENVEGQAVEHVDQEAL